MSLTDTLNQSETLHGEISSVRCHYPDKDGWGIYGVKVDSGEHVVTGCLRAPEVGLSVECVGSFRKHSTYGLQFIAKNIIPTLPSSKEGVVRLLTTFPGIGKKRAEKLYERHGENVLQVIAEDDWALGSLKGLKCADVAAIRESISERRETLGAEQEMAELGIGPKTKEKIFEKYGEATHGILANGPYDLVRIPGIGFLTIDRSLLSRGRVQVNDTFRLSAAINYLLKLAADSEGHTYLDYDSLQAFRAKSNISFGDDEAAFRLAVIQAIEKGLVVKIDEGLALPYLDEAEREVAKMIRGFLDDPHPPFVSSIKNDMLTEEQIAAVRNVLNHRVSVLTGGPGTGKTTTLKEVVSHFDATATKLIALSGMAALKMQESTERNSSTIHSFLIDLEKGMEAVGDIDLLIIDEFSMVPIDLFFELLAALDTHGLSPRIMMVGDVDQIPSIGPGRILGELIESKVIPTTILTKVHRQAQGSLIITNANRVKHGRMLTTSHEIGANSGIALRDDFFLTTANDENKVVNMLKEAYQKRIPGLIKRDGTPINPARDVLLICPQKTGTLGVRNINKVLQELLNPNLTGAHTLSIKRGGKDFEIRLKDRVIVTKNLNQRYLVNGDIGTVTSISASSFVARFDGGREFEFKPDNFGNVDLGYSITVHKSQGSQAPMVIALFHSAAPMMRQRNLFYTAITRPEDYLWVIGKPHIIKSCIENDTPRDRLTRLKSLLTAPDRT